MPSTVKPICRAVTGEKENSEFQKLHFQGFSHDRADLLFSDWITFTPSGSLYMKVTLQSIPIYPKLLKIITDILSNMEGQFFFHLHADGCPHNLQERLLER